MAEIGDTFKSTLRQNLLADSSYETDRQEGDPPTRFEWLEKHHPHLIDDAAKEMVVRATENDRIGNIIINMQWSTLDMSASRHELLTGDMPHLRYYGLKDPRCAILFPLMPTKLFIATHDRKTEHNINRRDKIIFGSSGTGWGGRSHACLDRRLRPVRHRRDEGRKRP